MICHHMKIISLHIDDHGANLRCMLISLRFNSWPLLRLKLSNLSVRQTDLKQWSGCMGPRNLNFHRSSAQVQVTFSIQLRDQQFVLWYSCLIGLPQWSNRRVKFETEIVCQSSWVSRCLPQYQDPRTSLWGKWILKWTEFACIHNDWRIKFYTFAVMCTSGIMRRYPRTHGSRFGCPWNLRVHE